MKKIFDLKTTEGRIEALKNLNGNFKKALKEIGVTLHEDALCDVNPARIEISIKDTNPDSNYFGVSAFGSGVAIYINEKSVFNSNQKNHISYGSGGSFDPLVDTIQSWKTIHATSLIQHWEKVSSLANEYSDKHTKLMNDIKKINNL